ncbi:MAG: hypothetical protein ACLR92_02070 [Bacilli bacterium]
MYAQVLVEIKAKAIDKTFTYKIPDGMILEIGMRVLVPFGKRTLEGFVLKIEETGDFDYEVKSIISVTDDHPVINGEMLKLGQYISKKTLSPLICAYQTMLPSALKAKNNFTINKKYVNYLIIGDTLPTLKTDKQKEIFNLVKEKGKVLKKRGN